MNDVNVLIDILGHQIDNATELDAVTPEYERSKGHGDNRFWGFLGEIVFSERFGFKLLNLFDYDIIDDGLFVDVKSSKQSKPCWDGWVIIQEHQLWQECDIYSFMKIDVHKKFAIFLGYYDKSNLERDALIVKKGDYIKEVQHTFRDDCRLLNYTKHIKGMTEMKIDKMVETVHALIVNDKRCADSDLRLQYTVHALQLKKRGDDIDTVKYLDVLVMIREGKLTKPETIRRARRKCQELHAETRGEKYQNRQSKQKEVISELRDADKSAHQTECWICKEPVAVIDSQYKCVNCGFKHKLEVESTGQKEMF